VKIFVSVKTKAKGEKIEPIEPGRFRVSVNVPPEGGKANRQVIRVVAKYFKVPASRVQILSGTTSKTKLLEIQ